MVDREIVVVDEKKLVECIFKMQDRVSRDNFLSAFAERELCTPVQRVLSQQRSYEYICAKVLEVIQQEEARN